LHFEGDNVIDGTQDFRSVHNLGGVACTVANAAAAKVYKITEKLFVKAFEHRLTAVN
jgi:hypothetical protein